MAGLDPPVKPEADICGESWDDNMRGAGYFLYFPSLVTGGMKGSVTSLIDKRNEFSFTAGFPDRCRAMTNFCVGQ